MSQDSGLGPTPVEGALERGQGSAHAGSSIRFVAAPSTWRRVVVMAATSSRLVYGSVAGFALLMTISMWLYPGGHIWDTSSPGYDFWLNFWCDLLRQPAYNGVHNPVAPKFAQGAMLVLSVGLAAYFLLAPRLFAARRSLGRLVSVLGVLGAIGLALVSGLSSGHLPKLHGAAVLVAAPTGLSAALVTLIGLIMSRRSGWLCVGLGAAAFSVSLFSFVQYAREFAFAAPSSPWLPLSQKVATLLALCWMCVVSARAQKNRTTLPRPGHPASDTSAPSS